MQGLSNTNSGTVNIKKEGPEDLVDGCVGSVTQSSSLMPAYSPSMRHSQSPHSMTDGDSAIGGDSSTSPELRHETDFSDEKEENFECFGENDGPEFERLAYYCNCLVTCCALSCLSLVRWQI